MRLKTTDLAQIGSPTNPTAWWLGNPNFYDTAGHLLGSQPGGAAQPSYAIPIFSAGRPLLGLQTIESAILATLAAGTGFHRVLGYSSRHLANPDHAGARTLWSVRDS